MEEQKKVYLDQVFSQSATNEFWAIRGKAIASYAGVEQGLCMLFSVFADVKLDVASLIFFRIQNTKTLGEIFDLLLKKKHGEHYSVFWKSFDKTVRQLTETRNRIVHWSVANNITGDGLAGLGLVPPDFWNMKMDQKQVTKDDLIEFMMKCDFVNRLCTMFFLYLQPETYPLRGAAAEQAPTWREIFQQPIVYPPPSSHPLCQIPKVPETPPPPSPASPQL